jgi:hypothetical protein
LTPIAEWDTHGGACFGIGNDSAFNLENILQHLGRDHLGRIALLINLTVSKHYDIICVATSLINIVQHNYNRSAILMEVG